MENKCFAPNIEDLCIGYELEVNYNFKLNDIFNKKIIDSFEQLADIHSRMVGDCVIRVPYLTKEQIEAEGWKLLSEDKYLQFIKPDYSISYVEKLHLLTVIALEEKQSDVKYSGTCKDINTFRKIIKLLGI